MSSSSCWSCEISGPACQLHGEEVRMTPAEENPYPQLIRPTSGGDWAERLASLVTRLIRSEGAKWVSAPCPFPVVGCSFCARPWKNHDEKCLIVEAARVLKEYRETQS